MRILAIDTATSRPSLALVADGSGPRIVDLPPQAAEALAPAVAALLSEGGIEPRGVDLVAVVSGPGSFTGLRSSVAFARGFARAAGARLVSVPTFAAASAALPDPPSADLVLDALRGEVHRRRRRGGELEPTEDRVSRARAAEDAARAGVVVLDLDAGDKPLRLASHVAAIARTAPPDPAAALVYGRPPAAEERFGPGEER